MSYNDKVLIVQMKGAGIQTANSSSFGDTTGLNNAGNYEIATVCHTDGDSLFLVFMLLNDYTVSGKVQVVKIPQYTAATVIDTLKAAPWNNTTGRGGIIAISVENDLQLNAPVFSDSSGFRGGAFMLSGNSCSNFSPATNYIYNANFSAPSTQNGAFKGEGVADVTAAQSGGRGAPANGGGGGNNHNNGGAGGANLSSGGNGGGNSSSSSVCYGAYQGQGGKAMNNYGGTKIFLGGGGGAGHANNGIITSHGGGHGGGIIFIEAGNIYGSVNKIVANGRTGGPAISDGASGGGAGGTILLNVANYTGAITIQANGGIGGGENDNGNVGRCYGAGGGGSGGAIYFNGAIPSGTVSVNGGAGGLEIGRDASCGPIVPAGAGESGLITTNYNYSVSTILASSYCALLLPVQIVSFEAVLINGQVLLKWKITEPESAKRFVIERSVSNNSWITLQGLSAHKSTDAYQVSDPAPKLHYNFYRLKIISNSNEVSYSPIRKVYIPLHDDKIIVYPNPSSAKFTIIGSTPLSDIFLFDVNGRLILHQKNSGDQRIAEVNTKNLNTGVYVLKTGTTVKKLVIR